MPIESRKDKKKFQSRKDTTNVKSRYHNNNKKKNGAINMTFGIQDKAPDAIR